MTAFKLRMTIQSRYLRHCSHILGIAIELNMAQMYRFAILWDEKHK